MDIEAIRLDMPLVTSGGIKGKVVAISKEGGLWLETADRTRFPAHVECVKPATPHFYCDDATPLKSLFEVAKCYKQVGPEDLFLSEDAKLVCEMLRANGPMTSHEISDRWCLSERVILEYLLEAREAGIVRLDDGKYSIVRD